MKIIFISGSLEEGKDGVGDYTRRLAGELIKLGHECRVVALMDRFVVSTVCETQRSETSEILIFRLPFYRGYIKNSKNARDWIDDYDPDWVSLQYVPFIYNDKGLPFQLSSSLRQLFKGRNSHIMFHELWVGMDTESNLKLQLWGSLQKSILKRFLSNISPDQMHTHTELYSMKLGKLGFKSAILPLFGNIPLVLVKKSDPAFERDEFRKSFKFVFFGTIHFGAPIVDFVNSLANLERKSKKIIEFIFIGKCGLFIVEWISVLENSGFNITITGEISAKEISILLSSSDFGITTTPIILAQKSGTVAAMQEHGLPIICVSRKWEVKNYDWQIFPPGISVFDKDRHIDYLQTPIRAFDCSVLAVSLLLLQSFSIN